MNPITITIQFKDAEDRQWFERYAAKARETDGTVTGALNGIQCAALKRATIKPDAAPELLEALKECEALLTVAYQCSKTETEVWKHYPRVWNMALAAIAKATGN